MVDAVRCAIEVQNGMVERNAGLPPERRVEFRIGIHLGDVVEEADGDLMGDGVNIAARLEGVCEPGAICLSEDAYRQVSGRLDMAVTDLGPTQLKNIERPIRVLTHCKSAYPPRRSPQRPKRARGTRFRRWGCRGYRSPRWPRRRGLVRLSCGRRSLSCIFVHFPAIAVLPFDDPSPDKSLGYLGATG